MKKATNMGESDRQKCDGVQKRKEPGELRCYIAKKKEEYAAYSPEDRWMTELEQAWKKNC